MTEEQELKALNPDIRMVQIGVRELYNLTIYPLSFGQQIKLSETIGEAVASFYQNKDGSDAELVAFIVKLLGENAKEILGYITDPDEVKEIMKGAKEKEITNCLTNKQLFEIGEHIYEDNFKDPSEKVRTMFETIRKEYLSDVLSPESSEDIPSTDLSTSSEEAIEKEASQSDKH
jgi:hypothetical protein